MSIVKINQLKQILFTNMRGAPSLITDIIEFFANPVPLPGGDPSGHGEGAIYLGSKRPNLHEKFTATLSLVAVGTLITATATDANGNTSEFAANIAAIFP